MRRRKKKLKIDWRKIVSYFFSGMISLWIIAGMVSYLYDSVTDKVAIIKIDGVIGYESSLFTKYANVEEIVNQLEKAKNDPSVKGIIIEINSPGGSVVATREVAHAVENISKPKVALIKDSGTSGAYWIATFCDKIIADNFSLVGSIGATASYLEYSGLLKKYNITYVRIVSGELKDIGSPYREPSEEELEWFNKTVMEIHKEFVRVVAENRNLSIDEVNKIADGRVMLGNEALKLKLIDEIGYEDKAIDEIEKMVGKELTKVVYGKKANLFDLFFSSLSNFIPLSNSIKEPIKLK